MQNLEKNLTNDGEATMGLTCQEPQTPKGPGEYGNWDIRGVSDSVPKLGTGLGIYHHLLGTIISQMPSLH